MEDRMIEAKAKADEKLEEYIRRQAVIKSKFPEYSTRPQSVQDELSTLITLSSSLQYGGPWGPTIASDGCKTDRFFLERYERALKEIEGMKEQNEEYISQQEEDAFEFPEIDFDSLSAEINAMTTESDYRKIEAQLREFNNMSLPKEARTRVSEIREQFHQQLKDVELVNDTVKQESDVRENGMVTVEYTKFGQIYEGAKGRIKDVVSKIKSFFKEKVQGKNIDDDNTSR